MSSRYKRILLKSGFIWGSSNLPKTRAHCSCIVMIWAAVFSREFVLLISSITRLLWKGSFARISRKSDCVPVYSVENTSSLWSISGILFVVFVSLDFICSKSKAHCLYCFFSSDEIPLNSSQKWIASSIPSAKRSRCSFLVNIISRRELSFSIWFAIFEIRLRSSTCSQFVMLVCISSESYRCATVV